MLLRLSGHTFGGGYIVETAIHSLVGANFVHVVVL
jgi:hypothetical protein